jgi:hypothetical protein
MKINKLFLIFLAIFLPIIVLASTTDGTIDSVYKYSWGENIGWLNFGTNTGDVYNEVRITDTILTGYVWSPNYGWINLAPIKSGVKNNSEGTLSGYAWGENLGWINFTGVAINASGEFTGTSTGVISGDISFNCANCKIKTDWRPLSVRQPTTPPGGGGGGTPTVITQIIFSGKAYPLSRVTILKDGQIAVTTIAGLDANFSVSLSNLSAGNYLFSVFSEDSQNRRSSSFNFPVTISQGATTNITGIFLSPTIDVDKIEVRRGDNIAILGQSVPQGEITIQIGSEEEFFVKTKADKNGAYLSWFDTSPLAFGQHLASAKAATEGLISSFSQSAGFTVGTKSVTKVPAKCPAKADLNNDCKVNLIDFSIAAYWYKRPLSESFKKLEKEKLNGDEKINLTDFSIMAYYWTG